MMICCCVDEEVRCDDYDDIELDDIPETIEVAAAGFFDGNVRGGTTTGCPNFNGTYEITLFSAFKFGGDFADECGYSISWNASGFYGGGRWFRDIFTPEQRWNFRDVRATVSVRHMTAEPEERLLTSFIEVEGTNAVTGAPTHGASFYSGFVGFDGDVTKFWRDAYGLLLPIQLPDPQNAVPYCSEVARFAANGMIVGEL